MTRSRGEHRPIPIRDLERERAAAAPSEVKTYTLPPEEIEKIFSKSKKPEGKPSPLYDITHLRAEELIEVNMTKEQYLQERLSGKNRSAIMKQHFGKNTTLFYGKLKEWDIKDPAQEEIALAELRVAVTENDVAIPDKAEPPMADDRKWLLAEIERLKAANVEAVALAGKAAEKFQDEIERLRTANDDLKAELEQLKQSYSEGILNSLQEIDRLRAENAKLSAEIVDLIQMANKPEPVTDVVWFTPEVVRPDPHISVSSTGVSFDPEATRVMGLEPGQTMQIGMTEDKLVFKIADDGFKLQRAGESTVRFTSERLAKWPRFADLAKTKYKLVAGEGVYFAEVSGHEH